MSVKSSRFYLFKRSNQIYHIGHYRECKRRRKLILSNPFKEVTFADVPDKAPAFFTAGDFQKVT